jgi:hypothetical protein
MLEWPSGLHPTDEEAETTAANAALICSAPEMLAMLERISSELFMRLEECPLCRCSWANKTHEYGCALNTLIKKAKGET